MKPLHPFLQRLFSQARSEEALLAPPPWLEERVIADWKSSIRSAAVLLHPHRVALACAGLLLALSLAISYGFTVQADTAVTMANAAIQNGLHL